MKNILSILLLFSIFSCSKEETSKDVNDESDSINKDKVLKKSTYSSDNNSFVEYQYNSLGYSISAINNKGQLVYEHSYNSQNLIEMTNSFRYVDSELDAKRIYKYEYDDLGRLEVRKQEHFNYGTDNYVDTELDSISYDLKKIISIRNEVQNPNSNGEYEILRGYRTEYILNDLNNLVQLKSTEESLGGVFESNLLFSYDEKNRCIKIIGEYTDYDYRNHRIEVNTDFYDIVKKGNFSSSLFEKNYLRSQSEPAFSEIFILNFLRNSSLFYLKNIEIDLDSEGGMFESDPSTIKEVYTYDYKFDEYGYPIKLNYDQSPSDYASETIYEWE